MEQKTGIKGRRRGDIVPFSRIPTTAEITELPAIYNQSLVNFRDYQKGDMCPYSPYIPLCYVTSTTENGSMAGNGNRSRLMNIFFTGIPNTDEMWEKCRERLHTHKMKDIIWRGFNSGISGANQSKVLSATYQYMDAFLKFDWGLNITNIHNRSFHTKEYTTMQFKGEGSYNYNSASFSFRTYDGYVAPYSLWITRNRVHVPHVLAVIRAEDWAYQRLYILLHNKPDLSRIVVLVDNRVDGDFPHPAFKGYYREQLEPALKKLSCPVFKVPHEFIMENCFVQDYVLQEKNIFKRKEAVNNMISEFYKKYGRKEEDSFRIQGEWLISSDAIQSPW